MNSKKNKLNLLTSFLGLLLMGAAGLTPPILKLTSLATPSSSDLSRIEKEIDQILETNPASVNERDRAYVGDGRNAMHEAAAIGNLALLKKYVAVGGQVNSKNSAGETPLHFAARKGHLEVVKFLVANQARVNEPTTYTKATPLMAAAETGQVAVIKFLMKSGAKKNVTDAFGKTAPRRYHEYNPAYKVRE